MGTNVVGPHLLTRLLEPTLQRTAQTEPRGSVRIVWVASMIVVGTPEGGIVWNDTGKEPTIIENTFTQYMQSKAGVVYLAYEYARRLGNQGITSVVCADTHSHTYTPRLRICGVFESPPSCA